MTSRPYTDDQARLVVAIVKDPHLTPPEKIDLLVEVPNSRQILTDWWVHVVLDPHMEN